MRGVSRRYFMAGVAGAVGTSALPFSVWSGQRAQAAGPLTRYDASTPEGEVMIEKYARAVATMMEDGRFVGTPKSWLFQWYTHTVDPTKSMSGEIERLYGNADPNDPNRLLALAMWNTCQTHGSNGLPQDYRMFLPWHRMYLYYFERIIRAVLADDSFTLPYWDYTTEGKHGIPQPFRQPNNNLYGSLYRDNRNKGNQLGTANVNAGQPIDKNARGNPLNLSVLKERDYERRGVAGGFDYTLDNELHGAVHVLVGDTTNMGRIPWAARDPIFWLHHCNIDRLWASWNKGGRANPSGNWLTQSFVFSDEKGKRVDAVVGDFVDTETIKVGPYKYDKLEPVPLAPVPVAATAAAAPAIIASQVQPGPINLRPDAEVIVSLTPAAVPVAAPPQGESRVFLVLQNLQANAQPGILYEAYLDVPSAGSTRPQSVGTFNFFEATTHGPDHGATQGRERVFSFDVTDIASAGFAGAPTARIAPVGTAAADANPVVGSVSLVRQ
jgi:tyrosinase